MKELQLTVQNKTGLHARPAKALVNLAKQYQSNISIQYGEKRVSAKSMISVLTLGVKRDGLVEFRIEGEDEDAAAVAIEAAVADQFGEADEHHKNGVVKKSEPQRHGGHGDQEDLPQRRRGNREDERVLSGVAVADGVAIGEVWRYARVEQVDEHQFDSVVNETSRLTAAIEQAKHDLAELQAGASEKVGSNAEIFGAHLELLSDTTIFDVAVGLIRMRKSAFEAWKEAMDAQAHALTQTGNAILAERAADVRDVRDRVLALLSGSTTNPYDDMPDEPIILVADELLPSDTVGMDTARVLAICTADGSATSHSAILARSLNVPSVMGFGAALERLQSGQTVIVDGKSGRVTLNPTENELKTARSNIETQSQFDALANEAAGELAYTQDGKRIEVVANVGSVDGAQKAAAKGAEGVGLCRTEFLFLDREDAPTLDEQTEIYRGIAEALHGHPVIFRTLDVGGDKPLPYIQQAAELNPFLGIRGIRLTFQQPDLLRDQLKAILSAGDNVRIMFPMVSDIKEWRAAKKIVDEVRQELGVKEVECGIMIEVPSAALTADAFAPEVDFFSVGTNDLTQYTMAMDRLHPELAKQADGLHPAVLRLIKMTVDAAHAHGKWVGVCGELAADKQACPILVGLGVDELSVSGGSIPRVKAAVRTLTMSDAEQLAKRALACATAEEVRSIV